MAESSASSSSSSRVHAYRARLRAQGLRPVQLWVPDVRREDFAEQAHRQSVAIAKTAHARADQDFIDSITSHDW